MGEVGSRSDEIGATSMDAEALCAATVDSSNARDAAMGGDAQEAMAVDAGAAPP